MRHTIYRPIVLLGIHLQEVFRQKLNVLASFAQWWHVNRNCGDAIEKIVAQQTFANSISRQAIRRANQTKIDRIRLFRTYFSIAAFL